MSSQVASSTSTSAAVACHHNPVWVVEAARHRVVRKPCLVCQQAGENSTPGVQPREASGPTIRPSSEASRGRIGRTEG